MTVSISHVRNARSLKALSLVYLILCGVAVALVNNAAYEPAVSFIPLYLSAAVFAAGALALLALPERMFTARLVAGSCVFYAAFISLIVYFTGASASELYLLYLPLLLAPAFHRSWKVKAAAFVSVLLGYVLAMLPDALGAGDGAQAPAVVLLRLLLLALIGAFAMLAGRKGAEEEYAADEDGSTLVKRAAAEISARREEQVAAVLVDPGRDFEGLPLLLERVRRRIAEPVPLGEGAVFGLVLPVADEEEAEDAARRSVAAAASLGAKEVRAGAAVYPHDAPSAEELLVAAGEALEAAFEVGSPSALVLAGRRTGPVRRVVR